MFEGFEAVIGLEIHAQLKTKSKLFSCDSAQFEGGDNEHTSPVSVGLPGALPVLNQTAVEYSIRAGLALNCKINVNSTFSRKNYFYPDLPKGYQISQYDEPICGEGLVEYYLDGKKKSVKIVRAHIEEDAGKSTHSGECTLINYNRSGVPLLEIVTAPDIRSPAEAAAFVKSVRQALQYVDVCDGNLEEGSLRCDCNISVRRSGTQKLGTKVEIKNLNSFRFIEKALEFEIERQIDAVNNGEKIVQETRLYDSDKNRTFTMRTKEDAQDYRYFPDPDLPVLKLNSDWIASIKDQMPQLPLQRYERFIKEFQLPDYDAQLLTNERALADYFEAVLKVCDSPKMASNWIMGDLLRALNESKIPIDKSPITPESLGRMLIYVNKGIVSGKMARIIFDEMWKTSKEPDVIINEKGLVQISDSSELEKIIDQILSSCSQQVQEYKRGKTKVFSFLIGQIMKLSRGQANPDVANDLLKKKLGV